jgi:hypothetical protein
MNGMKTIKNGIVQVVINMKIRKINILLILLVIGFMSCRKTTTPKEYL